MRPHSFARLIAALAAVCMVGLAAPSPAQADTLGGLDVVPAQGSGLTLVSVVTERGCAEPAQRVSAVLTGKGLPDEGQIVVAPSEVLFSTTRPMELPLSNAFVIYADRNNAALQGTYRLIVRCTDRIGVNVIDEFATTMKWSTPGGSVKNAEKATFVAKSTAGIVSSPPPSPKGSKDADTDSSSGGSAAAPETQTPTARPGEQPLANDERPDGSNPDAERAVSGDALEAAASSEGNRTTTILVFAACAAALVAAGWLFFRGRRST